MKRLSLYLFLIFFTFPTPSQADDIRDFQIEGMSIGDNVIDFFDEEKIIKKDPYKKRIVKGGVKLRDSTYDQIRFAYSKNDKKMKTLQIQGIKFFDDIKKCKLEKAAIEKEFDIIFANQKKNKFSKSHSVDPSKKSKVDGINYHFKNAGFIHISCNDMKKFTDRHGKKMSPSKSLKVEIVSDEYANFLRNEAY